jgi:peptide/nickel transport system permease protein
MDLSLRERLTLQIVFFPAIFLSMTVLAVNLLGDGLRDALDPRMMKRL